MKFPRTAVAVAGAALAAAGCGTADDQREARATVERFYDAVRHHDGAAACAELSDATRKQLESQTAQSCESVVDRLDYRGGAVVRSRVFVTSAKVDLRGGESAFLDREPDGWRISAAGCRPEEGPPRDHPYDCEAEA